MMNSALEENGESWSDVEANTMTDDEMAKNFDSGYGATEGCPFTVWTKNTVYFPLCYDGSEWVGSVSRNPDGRPTNHQGVCWTYVEYAHQMVDAEVASAMPAMHAYARDKPKHY